jgi:hypothetical protein
MTAPLPPLHDVAPQTPAGLIDFIERATAFDMDARWPDAVSMQRALRQVVDVMRLPPSVAMAPPATGGPVLDGPGPTTGSGGSGPRVDTGRMVFGGAQPERDPSTLQATETSAVPPAKSRVGMAAAVFVVTLVAGIAIGAKVLLPGSTQSAATPAPVVAPVPPPPPTSPQTIPAGTAPPMIVEPSMELPATPNAAGDAGVSPGPSAPPAVSAQPTTSITTTTTTTSTTTSSRHHHAKPADGSPGTSPPSANPFDQRF